MNDSCQCSVALCLVTEKLGSTDLELQQGEVVKGSVEVLKICGE